MHTSEPPPLAFQVAGSWSHWPPLCGPPSNGIQQPSATGCQSDLPEGICSFTCSHCTPFTSWTRPFSFAPFRGQSPPPPPRGPPRGEGRQLTPVQLPCETAQMNSFSSAPSAPVATGFIGHESSWNAIMGAEGDRGEREHDRDAA